MRKVTAVLLLLIAMAACSWCLADEPYFVQQERAIRQEMAAQGKRYVRVMDSLSAAGIDMSTDPACLVVQDPDGVELLRLAIPFLTGEDVAFDGMVDCAEDDSGGYFVLLSLNETTDAPLMGLYHLSGEGRCLMSCILEERAPWGWSCLAGDKEGGAFLVHAGDDDYREAVIRHVSGEGRIEWQKRMAIDGLVFSLYDLEAGESGITIFGTAVSASKGVYLVTEVQLDGAGDVTEARAWDYKAVSRDRYAGILKDRAAGMRYLYVQSAQYYALEELPECDAPSVTISIAGTDVH